MGNTNNIAQSKKKFGMKDKIGYLFGDLGAEGYFDLSSTFLMVFYTDIFGINPALTGTIFLVARLWDAFMDVTAGRFIDRRPNRVEGKYKPWIIRFAPVLMISGIIMYIKIPGLSNTFYLIYAIVTYTLWGTCHSFATIPYGSMAAVITGNSTERAALSTYRSIASNVAQMVTKSLIPIVAFTNNKPDATKFVMVAVFIGIFGMISYTIFYKLSTERIIIHKPRERANLLTSLKGLSKNRPFGSFMIVAFMLLITLMINTTLNTYLYKDYFKSTAAMSLTGVVLVLNILLIAPLVAPISKKFGKKESACGAFLFSAIAYLLLFIIPIKNAYLFVGLQWIANAGTAFFNFMNWAFIADIVDWQELAVGRREDGTVLSLYTFCRKLGQSVSGAISGIVLSVAGYVKAPQQTPEVALKIRNTDLLIPVFTLFVMFLVMKFLYPMTKEKVEQVAKELAEKRAVK